MVLPVLLPPLPLFPPFRMFLMNLPGEMFLIKMALVHGERRWGIVGV